MQIGCAVIYHEKKLLLLKKAYGFFKDKYEFPGGKREESDTSIKSCLKRELLEEIGCKSTIGKLIYFMKVPKEEVKTSKDLHLYFYDVELKNFNIEISIEHTEFVWATIQEAKKLDMIKWDYDLLEYLKEYYAIY